MRIIKSATLAALLVITGTTAALAHATMTASVPKEGASVTSPVSEIELTFSKPMRLTLVKVTRVDDRQQLAIRGELPKAFGTSVKTSVTRLPAGPYEVSWTAVAEDGHVMKGSFAFSVSEEGDGQRKQ